MIGFGKRISYAVKTFLALLTRGALPDEVVKELAPAPAVAPVPPPPVRIRTTDDPDRAVQILTLLQRDGRLVDFLTEDLSSYTDVQIGAAVREVHRDCRQSLARYVTLEPVMDLKEGSSVTVGAEVDLATVKLLGHGVGRPPVTGLLRHRGWRVTKVNLPPLSEGSARMVVAPAEVESE